MLFAPSLEHFQRRVPVLADDDTIADVDYVLVVSIGCLCRSADIPGELTILCGM